MKDLQEIAFEIILHAGESKNYSFQAMQKARNNDFDEADKLISKASEELKEAHQAQTDLLVKEARGETSQLSIIFIHAQDHLAMAIFAKDMASEHIEGFKSIHEKIGV